MARNKPSKYDRRLWELDTKPGARIHRIVAGERRQLVAVITSPRIASQIVVEHNALLQEGGLSSLLEALRRLRGRVSAGLGREFALSCELAAARAQLARNAVTPGDGEADCE